MVDSGASETVACSNKFIGYDTVETSAIGTLSTLPPAVEEQ